MNRDKYPEKVPFRLTRMLIKAMEVSGIEGSYRSTCERTMTVLRDSRDSLVAMLEAFVYDPLISWRLVDLSGENSDKISLGPMDGLRPANNGIVSHPLEGSDHGANAVSGVPIDLNSRSSLFHNPITEDPNEDCDDDLLGAAGASGANVLLPEGVHEFPAASQRRQVPPPREAAMSATRARSLQMYSNIQTWAANLSTDSRIASITGGERAEQAAATGSIARSRIERSMRQREMLSILEGEAGAAHEEALNEKALKVIRRVQDKLTGTDFPDRDENGDPLDVENQVQRLIVQATSVENLCQLFIGWYVYNRVLVADGLSCVRQRVTKWTLSHIFVSLFLPGAHFGRMIPPRLHQNFVGAHPFVESGSGLYNYVLTSPRLQENYEI
jgi:phosphatidylinositol kinase/protein kinase (PI-3  family)